MLRIPDGKQALQEFVKEIEQECMGSSDERGMIYIRAAQYYYQGTYDTRGRSTTRPSRSLIASRAS